MALWTAGECDRKADSKAFGTAGNIDKNAIGDGLGACVRENHFSEKVGNVLFCG